MGAEIVSTDLDVLAERINRAHAECTNAIRASLHHALEAGRLLLEAKSRAPHGAWLPWLEENCTIPKRTAQHYMRLARELPARLEADKSADLAHLTLTEAADLLARHREPVEFMVAVSSVPEPSEPLRVRMAPMKPIDEGALRVRIAPPIDESTLRPMQLTKPPDASALRPLDLRPMVYDGFSPLPPTQEGGLSEALASVHAPRSSQEQVAAAAGGTAQSRVISLAEDCAGAMDGARTLSEAVLQLNRVVQGIVQRLHALERDGWELQAPVEAGEMVLVRPDARVAD